MLQEYLAFGTFLTAVMIAVFSLSKFVVGHLKKTSKSNCKNHCNCAISKNRKLSPKPMEIRHSNYRSMKFK